MTKKSLTTLTTIGILLTSSLLVYSQTMPSAGGDNQAAAIFATPRAIMGQRTTPPANSIVPVPTPLPEEVLAYYEITSTKALIGTVDVLVQQAKLSACKSQLDLLNQAAAGLENATTDLISASSEYYKLLESPPSDRDWGYFKKLIYSALSNFGSAVDSLNQALQMTCPR